MGLGAVSRLSNLEGQLGQRTADDSRQQVACAVDEI